MNCDECGSNKIRLIHYEPFHDIFKCVECGNVVEEKKENPPTVDGPETYGWKAKQARSL